MTDGSIAWMLISTALVVFMVPGLALFYGGMVRTKNVGNMLMMNMSAVAIVPVLWVLFTFSLGNSGDGESGIFGGKFIGDFAAVGLDGIAGTDLVGVAFFMTFAAITPALISGAVADRMKFSAWLIFLVVWSIIVYTPVTYWVYTGWHHTWLDPAALDFAGGTAIHINAGVAALVLSIFLGKRRGLGSDDMSPHNLSLVLIGTGILWFGWFGFNAGSAGAADGIAAQALINTFVAGATGMLGWSAVEWSREGKPTILGAASGLIAGLVAITPAAGYVGTVPALAFGAAGGAVCFFAIGIKSRFGFDDSLDVVGIHGVGGIVGGLMLGLFASTGVNADGTDGLFYGQPAFLATQVIAMVSVIAFSFAATWGVAALLDAVIGLRVSEEDEFDGLDVALHGESVYSTNRRFSRAIETDPMDSLDSQPAGPTSMSNA